MLPAMSFFDRLRKMLAGPPHVRAGAAEEVALHEEFGTPDGGATDLRRAESLRGGAVVPGLAAAKGADAGEAEIASEEAPADPEP
jgi:hypothetical protein